MPRLKISCEGATVLPLSSLIEFQGNLKPLSKENFAKLRRTIERKGFSFPVSVWQAPDGINYILDGHQRLRIVRSLAEDGWDIPEIPVNLCQADSLKDAKERLLAAASQYGTVEGQGLYELMMEADLDFETLMQETAYPEIDFDDFKLEFFDADNEKIEDDKDEVLPKEEFLIVIQCRDEEHQQKIYEEMLNRGETCKIM